MKERDRMRRKFLGGIVVGAASGSLMNGAIAQSRLVINDPAVVQEIEVLFATYDEALGKNDVAALSGFFWDSSFTVRFGNGEILYGISEISAYRTGVATGTPRIRERTVITTYGKDFATVSARNKAAAGKIGRTMQTWVRFSEGWRIVAAHVSTMDEPLK
jgi:hypothetical protein